MKKIILTIYITALTIVTLQAQTVAVQDSIETSAIDSTSFTVSGNCGMCKRTIETAAMISGVSYAYWDSKSGIIEVVYDSMKINLLDIHKAIAAAGYDTEKVQAASETYNGLPGCCKYERTKQEDNNQNEK